ncbi:MAG: hypothetical protein EA385_12900 [Salinarimonadaceae bacterium]|nr:MAG: hypothetical protein EA385_12900 [Salinarimonadaceae bacterium]
MSGHDENTGGAPTGRSSDSEKTPGGEPGAEVAKKPGRMPAAGPHARPELSDDEAISGAGALTPAGEQDSPDSISG